jgi:dTDP-4-amino-4,6-dideoxygalactose transaminase
VLCAFLAAQSFGATYKGHKSCNLGTIGYTNFFPSKPLGCYGDGGAIFTRHGLTQIENKSKKIRVPLNDQPAYKHLCCPDCTPVAQQIAKQVISLPMHPLLSPADQNQIIKSVIPTDAHG